MLRGVELYCGRKICEIKSGAGGAGEGEEVCGACVSFMSVGAARNLRCTVCNGDGGRLNLAAGPDGYTRVLLLGRFQRFQLVCLCAS